MEILDYCARYAFKKITRSSGIKVHQIIVFDESDEPCAFSENASTHASIEDIKRDLRLETYRIEIRYLVHDKKYRAILRHDDGVRFPIRKDLGIFPKYTIREANVITTDDEFINVTKRIQKYAGQNGDFNAHAGSKIFVKDMFSFHDTDLYKALIIETTNGTLLVFDMDDIVGF